MQKAALPAAAVGLALVAFGKHALDSASNLQQAQGAAESVFGKQASAVEKLSKSSADSMGLAQSAYLQYAAVVGSALTNAGFSTKQAVDESNKVMQRGADLAATFGGTTADAVEAINAAVSRGEFDPLEKYGVSLNMTAVNAELAARGQDKLTGSALKHAKAQIVLESVYKNTSKAAGQFARESDTAAGSAARASANFEDASAALGQALLPAAAGVANALAAVAKWAAKNVTLVTVLAGVIGTLVAAILIYNAAMKIAAIVQMAFNVAVSANVIFLVIVAVIALVAVFVILYKKVGWFRKAVDVTWRLLKIGAKIVAQYLKNTFGAVFKAIVVIVKTFYRVAVTTFKGIVTVTRAVAEAVKTAWRNVRAFVGAVFDWIRQKASAVMSAVRNAFSTAMSHAAAAVRAVKEVLGNLVPPGLTALLTAPFNAAKAAINGAVDAIKSLISWVSNLISKLGGIHFPSVPSGLKGLLGKVTGRSMAGVASSAAGVSAYGYTPAPAVRSGRLGATAGAGAGGIVINIHGAIDPEGTARQINRIIGGQDRRVGSAPA